MPTRAANTTTALPVIHPHAAGAAIGATEICVAGPEDRDAPPVRCFTTCTPDLHALADGLQACGIQTLALESTGVSWRPFFQILAGRGIDVCLVHSRHVKHGPGRKREVADGQWLQDLHAVGLRRAACRPPQAVCAVRALLRHRARLVTYAAAHSPHLQKALTQMNRQRHHGISDLTGKPGLAILVLDYGAKPSPFLVISGPGA